MLLFFQISLFAKDSSILYFHNSTGKIHPNSRITSNEVLINTYTSLMLILQSEMTFDANFERIKLLALPLNAIDNFLKFLCLSFRRAAVFAASISVVLSHATATTRTRRESVSNKTAIKVTTVVAEDPDGDIYCSPDRCVCRRSLPCTRQCEETEDSARSRFKRRMIVRGFACAQLA